MKRLAVIMGSEEYTSFRRTDYCHSDVALLRDTLIKYCDFAEQDIVCKQLNVYESVSPNDLLNEIKLLVDKAEVGDTVLFYYAGHGDFYEGDSYLILPETDPANLEQTAIPLRDISDLMRRTGVTNVRIFDSCHSGQDVRTGEDAIHDFGQFSRSILTGSTEGWITFAACRADEWSYSDPSLKHGVFTYFLCDCITATVEGEEIFPETLKLEVFRKVMQWSEGNQRAQTPTFNSSISGNVSIAKRRVIESDSAKSDSGRSIDGKTVQARLASLREFDRIADVRQREILEESIAYAHKSMRGKLSDFDIYGSAPILGDIAYCNVMPKNIKVQVCKKFENGPYRTHHTVAIEHEYESQDSNQWGLMGSFRPRRLKSTKYIVAQDPDWPGSYFEVSSESDGYLPSSRIFIYIAPLLVTACVISGVYVGYDMGGNEAKLEFLEDRSLKLHVDEDGPKLDGTVQDLIEVYQRIYTEILQQRVSYLESELENI